MLAKPGTQSHGLANNNMQYASDPQLIYWVAPQLQLLRSPVSDAWNIFDTILYYTMLYYSQVQPVP